MGLDEFRLGELPASADMSNEGNLGMSARRPQPDAERAALDAAIAQTAEAVVVTDRAGTIQYVNPAFTRITGFSSEEALHQNPRMLKSGRKEEGFYEGLWSTISAGEVWNGELINRRKDGSFYTEEMSITPVRDSLGAIAGYIAIKRDVTERRAGENARRLLAAIVESSEDAILTHTPDRTITTWNRGAEALFGYRIEEVAGKPVSLLIPPEESDLFPRLISSLSRAEPVRPFESLVMGKDGSRIDVSIALTPIRDEQNRVSAVAAIVRDIRTRRQVEESRLLLASIVESTEDAIFCRALDGTVASWNKGAEAIFGYSAKEIVGRPLSDLIPPDRSDESARIRGAVLSGRGASPFETVRLAKGGRPIDVSLTVSSLRNAAGGIVGGAAIARDITAHKRVERELRNREELFWTAFEYAPIGMCLSSPDRRLLQVNVTLCRMRFAEVVQTSGETLLSLIDHVLDLSKIEAGKMVLESSDFDLRAMLEGIVEMLAIKAGKKGLDLTCLVEPETPSLLRGDPGRLRQVITNLASNAVKFTKKGEVSIRVEAAGEDLDRANLLFTIADTGVGIPKEKAATLFSPFVQADSSTTRKYGGTGLGLAISKQFVEMMGGNIGFESGPGRGSTFWFTAALEKQSAQPAPDTGSLRNASILVVDHSANSRTAVSALLQSWACRTGLAADADAALEALARAAEEDDPFEIALLDETLDEVLPGAGGVELAHRIDADSRFAGLVLLLMTPLGHRAAEHVPSRVFAGCVSKPILGTRLREAIEAATLRAKEAKVAAPAASLAPPRDVASSKSEVRILLAEDNPINREVALALLGRLGYTAHAVPDGAQAVKKLQTERYDLVLMDCMMPEMDGYEATRAIRDPAAGALHPAIPIIAVTASAMAGDRERCIQAGMDDCLTKPIEPEQLTRTIEKWLRKPGRPEIGAASAAAASPAANAVFDEAGLLKRLLGDKALAQKILAGFLQDIPAQLLSLHGCLVDGDAPTARRLAHTVKGAAATVSANALRAAAVETEEAVKAGGLDQLPALLISLENQFDRFKAALAGSKWDGN